MSKPRYNWWPFVLNMIQDYPARRIAYNALHEQQITANLSGVPGGGSARRTVENLATKLLPHQEQKEFDAVRKAVEVTRAMPDARTRMRVVDMTLMRKNYTVPGAAQRLNISQRTAQRFRWQFVVLVGHTYGFLTKEEWEALLKKDVGK